MYYLWKIKETLTLTPGVTLGLLWGYSGIILDYSGITGFYWGLPGFYLGVLILLYQALPRKPILIIIIINNLKMEQTVYIGTLDPLPRLFTPIYNQWKSLYDLYLTSLDEDNPVRTPKFIIELLTPYTKLIETIFVKDYPILVYRKLEQSRSSFINNIELIINQDISMHALLPLHDAVIVLQERYSQEQLLAIAVLMDKHKLDTDNIYDSFPPYYPSGNVETMVKVVITPHNDSSRVDLTLFCRIGYYVDDITGLCEQLKDSIHDPWLHITDPESYSLIPQTFNEEIVDFALKHHVTIKNFALQQQMLRKMSRYRLPAIMPDAFHRVIGNYVENIPKPNPQILQRMMKSELVLDRLKRLKLDDADNDEAED